MVLTALNSNVIVGERKTNIVTLPITDSTTITAGDFVELSSGKLITSITNLSTSLVGIANTTAIMGVLSDSGVQGYCGISTEGLIKVKGLVTGSGGSYQTAIAIGTKVSFYYDASAGYGQFVVNSTSAPCGTVVSGSVAYSGTTSDQWDYVLVELDFESGSSGGSGSIADGSVTASKLASNAVLVSKIASGAISSSAKFADGVITNSQLANGTLTGTKFAAGAISSSTYMTDGVITNSQLANGTLTGTKFASGAISSSVYLADGVVSTAKIANGIIINGTITTSASINDGVITNSQLANGTLQGTKFASGGINSSVYFGAAVITASQCGISVPGQIGATKRFVDCGTWATTSTETTCLATFNATLSSTTGVLVGLQVLTNSGYNAVPGSLTTTNFTVTGTSSQNGNWFAFIPSTSV